MENSDGLTFGKCISVLLWLMVIKTDEIDLLGRYYLPYQLAEDSGLNQGFGVLTDKVISVSWVRAVLKEHADFKFERAQGRSFFVKRNSLKTVSLDSIYEIVEAKWTELHTLPVCTHTLMSNDDQQSCEVSSSQKSDVIVRGNKKVVSFALLPRDVYPILQSLLSPDCSCALKKEERIDGYCNLMNSSKSLFSSIKRETIRIRCKTVDPEILFSVFRRVKDPSKQVLVSIPSRLSSPSEFQQLEPFMPLFLSRELLQLKIESINISGARHLQCFKNVRELFLCDCFCLQSLDGLEGSIIESLIVEFSYLRNISAISNMKKLKKVKFTNCSGDFQDISP
jgi:hypothetical protein